MGVDIIPISPGDGKFIEFIRKKYEKSRTNSPFFSLLCVKSIFYL